MKFGELTRLVKDLNEIYDILVDVNDEDLNDEDVRRICKDKMLNLLTRINNKEVNY